MLSTLWCSISHCVWLISLPCWQIWQSFWGNWIPNSLWVRQDILKSMTVLNVLMRQRECICVVPHMDQLSDWVPRLPMVDFYYNISTNETSTYLNCLMNIDQLTSWSIMASDWCAGSLCHPLVWLGKCLESCSRVANTLQAIYGFSFFLTCRCFCSWWSSSPFFKGLHIHLCDQCLGLFPIIDKWLDIVQAWASSWTWPSFRLQLWYAF